MYKYNLLITNNAEKFEVEFIEHVKSTSERSFYGEGNSLREAMIDTFNLPSRIVSHDDLRLHFDVIRFLWEEFGASIDILLNKQVNMTSDEENFAIK